MPEGRAARTPEGAGAPSSQAPTSLDYSEPWGRRDGESLNCREGNGQMRSGEAGRKAAEAELGRGVRGPTCSGWSAPSPCSTSVQKHQPGCLQIRTVLKMEGKAASYSIMDLFTQQLLMEYAPAKSQALN